MLVHSLFAFISDFHGLQGGGNARSKGKRAPNFKYGGVPMGRRPRDYGYDIEIPTLTASLSVSQIRLRTSECSFIYIYMTFVF